MCTAIIPNPELAGCNRLVTTGLHKVGGDEPGA